MVSETDVLAQLISAGVAAEGDSLVTCSGGDTHRNFRLIRADSAPGYFVKVSAERHQHVLESEYYSLQKMASLFPAVYPQPITILVRQGVTMLVMELLELEMISGNQWGNLGRLLVQHHQQRGDTYGWFRNNHIGLTTQLNEPCESWSTFFWSQRISPQLRWAQRKGLPTELTQLIHDLEPHIRDVLTAAEFAPTLLHGDLWSGNIGFNRVTQRPCLYDPAPYFGDPEADLAMTRLFGGFAPEFYRAYDARGFRRPGFEQREAIYNLYHALNHYNLFGAVYLTLVRENVNLITANNTQNKLF